MTPRETGPVEAEFSLWKATIDGKDEGFVGSSNVRSVLTFSTSFSHVITKTKCRVKPPEVGGGILADDMGLGKSLYMLALVAKTLEAAHSWQAGTGQESFLSDLSDLTKSRATIILVPSACMSDQKSGCISPKRSLKLIRVTVLLNEWRSQIDM